MPMGAATLAPHGFLQFCQREPQQCGRTQGADLGSDKAMMQRQWAAVFGLPAPAGSPLAPAPVVAAAAPAAVPPAAVTIPTAPVQLASIGALSMLPARPEAPQPGGSGRGSVFNTSRMQIAGGDERSHRQLYSPLSRYLAADLPQAPYRQASSPVAEPATTPSAPAMDTAAAATPKLDNALMERLLRVNARVNALITPMSDMEAFGADDVWTLPIEAGGQARGNCKHYALEKQRALIEAGLPAAALSLAIVRTSFGEMHAVLLVSTDRGEMVLDNLTAAVVSWRDVDYTWLERQKPGEPLIWVALETAGSRTRD